MAIRDEVIQAFRPTDGFTYSHKLPFQYSNFIDGMAWVGFLCGAAHIIKDAEVIELTEGYLNNLDLVGDDARNFAPSICRPEWEKSTTMPGFSFKRKPQAFAGNAAIAWAISKGAKVNKGKSVMLQAILMCLVAFPYGLLIRIGLLRQHINSMMFAHLMLGIKPPCTMKFLAKDNPVYQYIFKTDIDTNFMYPNTGAWPAKDWPTDKPELEVELYTPLCSLVGVYLGNSLA